MPTGASTQNIGTKVFGGYTITRLLGEGAMGAVFIAENEALRTKVAVKILHPHMAMNPGIAGRFLAEARAMAALDHPNVIKVHDASTLADGREYIAMEFLRGEPLDEFIKSRKQLGLTTTLKILSQVCCGLEAAHYRGIIHRDLKPGNIFVCPTKLNPLCVKILDFGIAKLSDPALAQDVETQTNAIAGTPGYMAPEQTRGMRDVDHRTDIYALGVIAYRMLTKQMPFTGDSIGEIFYQQFTADPTPIREHRVEVPQKWWELIRRSLDIEPSNRPSDASSFARELAAGIPYGRKTVQEVAPLLITEDWLAATRKMLEPRSRPVPAKPTPPGATLTYDGADSAPVASPVAASLRTTVAQAPETLRAISRSIEVRSSRRRPILAGVTTAILVAAGLLVFALVRGDTTQSANVAPSSGGTVAALAVDAGAAAVATVPAEASTVASDAGVAPGPDAAADAAPKKVDREKKPGRLRVKVSPWAGVSVNGSSKGNAPLTLSLAPGRYRVRLDGPKSETVSVKIRSGKTTVLRREW